MRWDPTEAPVTALWLLQLSYLPFLFNSPYGKLELTQ